MHAKCFHVDQNMLLLDVYNAYKELGSCWLWQDFVATYIFSKVKRMMVVKQSRPSPKAILIDSVSL